MNTYIIKSKVEKITRAKKDFYDLYGKKLTPFTRKDFFYFFIHNNKKYLHKESLDFVYSNADTFTNNIEPNCCDIYDKKSPLKIYDFLRNYKGKLLPKLLEENEKFLVYEYVNGNPIISINKEEYEFLKQCHDNMILTPFYNSMAHNLISTECGLKLVDFKHFEEKGDKPFFVYFFNEKFKVNELHFSERLLDIQNHLKKDYPVEKSKLIQY
jgi:hypothetical protein